MLCLVSFATECYFTLRLAEVVARHGVVTKAYVQRCPQSGRWERAYWVPVSEPALPLSISKLSVRGK